jgi:hypothetical protein
MFILICTIAPDFGLKPEASHFSLDQSHTTKPALDRISNPFVPRIPVRTCMIVHQPNARKG